MTTFIGIDVAKSFLLVCLLREGFAKPSSRKFDNTHAGFRSLLAWVGKHAQGEVRFCMEATGCYHMDLACFLLDEGLYVSVIEPRRIKHFGVGMGMKNKTDKADAHVIARYSQVQLPVRWHLADPDRRELFHLRRRLRQLALARNQEGNRLEDPRLPALVIAQIQENLERCREQEKQVREAIDRILARVPRVQTIVDSLQRIPGIGKLTAVTFACYVDPDDFDDAKQVAALAGLNPVVRQSGAMQGKTRLSKAGHALLRTSFYFPTILAMKSLPALIELRARLKAKGLKPKQVIAACMRKLLMTCYGIAKNALQGKQIYGITPQNP